MLITAEANVRSAELMRRAADMLSTEGAMQIRSLEVIERLAASPNTKMVFIPNNLSISSGAGGAGPQPAINISTNN